MARSNSHGGKQASLKYVQDENINAGVSQNLTSRCSSIAVAEELITRERGTRGSRRGDVVIELYLDADQHASRLEKMIH
jgi:hypothetical protein